MQFLTFPLHLGSRNSANISIYAAILHPPPRLKLLNVLKNSLNSDIEAEKLSAILKQTFQLVEQDTKKYTGYKLKPISERDFMPDRNQAEIFSYVTASFLVGVELLFIFHKYSFLVRSSSDSTIFLHIRPFQKKLLHSSANDLRLVRW